MKCDEIKCLGLVLIWALGCGGDADTPPGAAPPACVFKGPYELGASLAYGDTSPVEVITNPGDPNSEQTETRPGCEGVLSAIAQLQTIDPKACTIVACYPGGSCRELDCERGDPVELCTASDEYTFYPGPRVCGLDYTLTRQRDYGR